MTARVDLTPGGENTYTVSTLLGKRDEQLEVYGRRIVEITSTKSAKPLVLAIALKSNSLSTFKSIVKLIESHIQ